MDGQKRVVMIETKTVDEGTQVTDPVPHQRYQLDNHLGTACLELDDQAAVITYEEYHPYGSTSWHATRSGIEVSQKRYRYTGKEKDEESGLYYHGARYYACWLGRWISADPVGLVDGVNRYDYVKNHPTMFVDPNGSQMWRETIEGIRSANEWIENKALDIGETPIDVSNFAMTRLGIRNEQVRNTIRSLAALPGAGLSVQIQLVASFVMIGPNALESLDRAGTDIGEGAAIVWLGETWEEKAMGVARVSGGLGQGALVAVEALSMTSGAGGRTIRLDEGMSGGARWQRISSHSSPFESKIGQSEKSILRKTVDQVTIKPNKAPNTPADFNIRIDTLSRSRLLGKFNLIEAKSTTTARLSFRQRQGFPLIEQYGGTVRGLGGGPHFPAGTIIPPTRATIIRPIDWSNRMLIPATLGMLGTSYPMSEFQREAR